MSEGIKLERLESFTFILTLTDGSKKEVHNVIESKIIPEFDDTYFDLGGNKNDSAE